MTLCANGLESQPHEIAAGSLTASAAGQWWVFVSSCHKTARNHQLSNNNNVWTQKKKTDITHRAKRINNRQTNKRLQFGNESQQGFSRRSNYFCSQTKNKKLIVNKGNFSFFFKKKRTPEWTWAVQLTQAIAVLPNELKVTMRWRLCRWLAFALLCGRSRISCEVAIWSYDEHKKGFGHESGHAIMLGFDVLQGGHVHELFVTKVRIQSRQAWQNVTRIILGNFRLKKILSISLRNKSAEKKWTAKWIEGKKKKPW